MKINRADRSWCRWNLAPRRSGRRHRPFFCQCAIKSGGKAGGGEHLKAQRDAGEQTSELTPGEHSGKHRNRDLSTTLSSFPENPVCFLDDSAGRPKNRGVSSLMVPWIRIIILFHKCVGEAAVPVRRFGDRCATASHMIQRLYFTVRRASTRLVDGIEARWAARQT